MTYNDISINNIQQCSSWNSQIFQIFFQIRVICSFAVPTSSDHISEMIAIAIYYRYYCLLVFNYIASYFLCKKIAYFQGEVVFCCFFSECFLLLLLFCFFFMITKILQNFATTGELNSQNNFRKSFPFRRYKGKQVSLLAEEQLDCLRK